MSSKYNPYVVEVMNSTVEEVVRHLQEGTYSVSPDFQRSYVWNLAHQNALIESILLGYALPTFFAFTQDNEEGKRLTYFSDGQQRLTTLQRFMENKFRFKTKIESLKHLNGKKYKDFGIDMWIIAQYTIKIERWLPGTPLAVIKDHYDRINSRGVPLNLNSIRRNTLSGPYYDFLKKLSNYESYIEILGTKGSVTNVNNLEPEKFCQIWATLLHNKAFYKGKVRYNTNPALKNGDLEKHLGYYRDNPEEVTDDFKSYIENKFRKAIENIKIIFGDKCDYAFRRLNVDSMYGEDWNGDMDSYKFGPFNQGIFEIMMYFFSFAETESVRSNKEKIKEKYYNEIKKKGDFFLSIARGTTAYKAAKIRYSTFFEILTNAGVIFEEIV